MIEHALGEGGGVATKEFAAHVAMLAEGEAGVLKQNRLLREEFWRKIKNPAQGGDSGGNRGGKKGRGGAAGSGKPP